MTTVTDAKIYLHENLLNTKHYSGQPLNDHLAKDDDSDALFSQQQHFSDGFVNFIECVKQIRFELQTGQIDNHEAYDRLKQAEDDNGLPAVAYMDTNGIQMSGHADNIKSFFGSRHGSTVTIFYDMQGQLDGGDRRAVQREVDGNHEKNIKALTHMLDVQAEAVKAYDHDMVVADLAKTLAATFTKLGLPFDPDSKDTQMAISTMASEIHEQTEPSGHIVNRKLVPGGSK